MTDRVIDKLARGLATDFDDLLAIVRSAACPEPEELRHLAASVLADAPSSVFDPKVFRANYERLATLFRAAGRELGPP